MSEDHSPDLPESSGEPSSPSSSSDEQDTHESGAVDTSPSELGENRQPIVSVLGHVDHGKTSILDYIRSLGLERQASVMAREAGGITQHIGATEVPADLLNQTCAHMLRGGRFKSPGLLFIDTPGHHSFTSLRRRGGTLADIAILVVDVMEGLQPQSIESINILKQLKTPFVVAANKVDRIHGWGSEYGRSFLDAVNDQRREVTQEFEKRWWKLVGQFAEHGFNIERFDQIKDFTQAIAVVPCSAKEGEGLQDLLAVTVGLAERYLEARLRDTLGPAEGTVLEMKEVRGLGKTIDVILYRGELNKGDRITLVGQDGPFQTHIKGMFRPRGMSEMRDAGDRWDDVDVVEAAAGVKINGPDLEQVLAGTTLRLSNTAEQAAAAHEKALEEARIGVELDEEGVVIKADTLGGLEALAFELGKLDIPIRSATIGHVSKRDFITAENAGQPLHNVILAFSTKPLAEIATLLDDDDCPVKYIDGRIIYHIIEQLSEWRDERTRQLEAEQREALVFPGRIQILADHIFRRSGPAVVGIKVLGGRIHVGQHLMRSDGKRVGQIKSIRTGESGMQEAEQGAEVAVAIRGATVGRGIDEEDVLLVDIPEPHAVRLRNIKLNSTEQEIFDEIVSLHRKSDRFWGY
ncbi:MAG TPA: translation initiation factor IF-2 [Candidatus Poseidoniales archaeon]|nr:MAG: translation initiation factor IF-2 [Euryarchaeota archaeon]HIA89549.1 translation initiation factor IF-2 [Candidatus Poseidoniales archaeon]HIO94740.1 translation initiation factor IF-2 [Candidatus Poseidoniales archaeon]